MELPSSMSPGGARNFHTAYTETPATTAKTATQMIVTSQYALSMRSACSDAGSGRHGKNAADGYPHERHLDDGAFPHFEAGYAARQNPSGTVSPQSRRTFGF